MFYKANNLLTTLEYQDDGYFEGYASVFNTIDAHGDLIKPGAFKNYLSQWKKKKQMPKMLWQHDPSTLIGVWHDLYEDSKGLYVKGQLLLDLKQAKEAHLLLQAKQIDSMSIGYTIEQDKQGYHLGKNVRILENVHLLEISLVTFPANADAKIAHVKSEFYPLSEIEALCLYLNTL